MIKTWSHFCFPSSPFIKSWSPPFLPSEQLLSLTSSVQPFPPPGASLHRLLSLAETPSNSVLFFITFSPLPKYKLSSHKRNVWWKYINIPSFPLNPTFLKTIKINNWYGSSHIFLYSLKSRSCSKVIEWRTDSSFKKWSWDNWVSCGKNETLLLPCTVGECKT